VIFSSAAANQRWAVARNRHALDPRDGPGDQRYVARWDTQRFRDQLDERVIGFALGGRSAHPHLEDALAIVALFDAIDSIATAFGCQPHRKRQPSRGQRPRD
jgi:hypothetical protein